MIVSLFRFIKKFGTHIVVGVKMGGKDVIYLKQQHSSSLQAADVQKRLKEMSDRRFLDANGQSDMSFKDTYGNNKVLSDPLLPPPVPGYIYHSASVITVEVATVL